MGALFIGAFTQQSPEAKEIAFAIFDTGFCPNLIQADKSVTIDPVQDVTQSVNYSCQVENINARQFHGHWVLAQALKDFKPQDKVKILPVVIFDKYGNQSLDYWKKALEVAKKNKVSFILSAAGFPINIKDKSLINKASQITPNNIPMLLAAGRRAKGVKKDDLLFPQDFFPKENLIVFGTFHQGLEVGGPHFIDTSLLNPKSIDLFLPFNYKPRLFGNLKGTSLSSAIGTNYLLRTCSQLSKIVPCLKEEIDLKEIVAKENKAKKTLKTLNLSLMTKK